MYQLLSQYQHKRSKYNNKSKLYNGRLYDSYKEANYARDLDWRIKAKEIKEVIPQYKIDLKVNGKHICNYYCDFKVIMADDSIQFHEVKGFSTDLFILKRKLFEVLLNEIEPGAEYLIIR